MFWNMVMSKIDTSKPPMGLTTEIWKDILIIVLSMR